MGENHFSQKSLSLLKKKWFSKLFVVFANRLILLHYLLSLFYEFSNSVFIHFSGEISLGASWGANDSACCNHILSDLCLSMFLFFRFFISCVQVHKHHHMEMSSLFANTIMQIVEKRFLFVNLWLSHQSCLNSILIYVLETPLL